MKRTPKGVFLRCASSAYRRQLFCKTFARKHSMWYNREDGRRGSRRSAGGKTMAYADREKEILKLLENNYSIGVKELAKQLYASEPTIRRDLIKLEKKELIIRAHGKVIINTRSADKNMALSAREHYMAGIKNSIARAASTLIRDGNVIMLDASSTASYLIKYIENFKDVIVITSGIKTAYMLSQTGIKFICTGGECINESFSFIGQSAINTLKAYNADICFVSCHGLSETGVATDTSVYENDVRYAIMKQSKQRVLLFDDTKINNGFWHNLCDISEFDEVFCNHPLPDNILQKVKHFTLVGEPS